MKWIAPLHHQDQTLAWGDHPTLGTRALYSKPATAYTHTAANLFNPLFICMRNGEWIPVADGGEGSSISYEKDEEVKSL